MSRWAREEIEEALKKYTDGSRKGGMTNDWRDWADCFTEDATFFCHKHGKFWGRERIYNFVTNLMSEYPLDHMDAFPTAWSSIDVDKGWVFLAVLNRMRDLGDYKIYEEHNVTILHYAGDGLFSYEEDAYNPERMVTLITEWQSAKDRIEGKSIEN